jgi:hypothetical protein
MMLGQTRRAPGLPKTALFRLPGLQHDSGQRPIANFRVTCTCGIQNLEPGPWPPELCEPKATTQ